MEYRRIYVPGGSYFFTVVAYNRRPIFASPESIEGLRNAFQYTMEKHAFTIVASVILPDHMHFIWSLPSNTSDFSVRWRLVKSSFTRHSNLKNVESASDSRKHKEEAEIWQRRFWEHLIRDEADLSNHIDYIHFNPVKHGWVKSPMDWKYSSFMKFVQEGYYPADWGGDDQLLQGQPWME